MLGYTGYLLAPSVIGYVAQHVGFRFTYGAVALLLLIIVTLPSIKSKREEAFVED